MNADGTEPTNITRNSYFDAYPAWSPDGTKIAFTSYRYLNYDIYTMNSDGTEQTRLTSSTGLDAHPAWSPDGSKIAFQSNRDYNSEIYAMNQDGTGQTRLTSNGAYDAYPSWQPVTATVTNAAPNIESFTAPTDPVAVGTSFAVAGTFIDANAADTHTTLIEWGDGSSSPGTVTESNGSGSVSGSHAYSAPGVYTLTLTVTDNEGAADTEIFQYVVVYDPEAGFVTGNGLIDSPAGAYAADPTLSGKAMFGFVSRYQKGATTPSGRTQFKFLAGSLDFRSTSYEWLVISGAKAQFKGDGTINGTSGYGFLLTANDGQVSGGGGTDRFRIKIWEKATDKVVYDNQMGDGDDAVASTAIEAGSIVLQPDEVTHILDAAHGFTGRVETPSRTLSQ